MFPPRPNTLFFLCEGRWRSHCITLLVIRNCLKTAVHVIMHGFRVISVFFPHFPFPFFFLYFVCFSFLFSTPLIFIFSYDFDSFLISEIHCCFLSLCLKNASFLANWYVKAEIVQLEQSHICPDGRHFRILFRSWEVFGLLIHGGKFPWVGSSKLCTSFV